VEVHGVEGRPFLRSLGRDDLGEALSRSYAAGEDQAVFTRDEILARLESVRSDNRLQTEVVSLADLSSWEFSDAGISDIVANSFSIKQFAVSTTEREVNYWDQPLVTSTDEGSATLFCQEKRGILHFIFKCRREIGFREGLQYGPTIQDLGAGTFGSSEERDQDAELKEHSTRARVLLSCLQSDEGGRFYKSVSRYTICLLSPDDCIELDRNLSSMTLGQIEGLVKRPGVFSNEARSLVSMLLAYL
jgi:oxidase EvaA